MMKAVVALLSLVVAAWARATHYNDDPYSSYHSGGSSRLRSQEVKQFATCAKGCLNRFQAAVASRDEARICREYPRYERCLKSDCGRLGRQYFSNKIEHDRDFDNLERRCERRMSGGRRSGSRSSSPSSGRTRYGSPSRGITEGRTTNW